MSSISNKTKTIAMIAIMTTAALVIAIAVSLRSNNRVYAAELIGGQVAAVYMVGDRLEIPAAQLVHEEQTYDAVATLRYPGGRLIGAAVALLDEVGQYTLQYKAVAGGKILTASIQFQTADYLYEVSGTKSAMEYGTHKYAPTRQGVVLSLANGETFKFNKIVDLSQAKATENIVRLFATPEKIGQQDANIINITFTDAYDPSNQVTVNAKIYDSDWVSETGVYMTANASGQQPTGLEPYSGTGTSIPVVVYNGVRYRLHQNNEYGRWAVFSLLGTPQSGAIGDEFLEVSMDYANRQVFGTGGNMVVDLDESLFFNDIWGGFTTGEVYVSISASGYQTAAMNLVVTNIAGEDLSDNRYIDIDAPSITVDYAGYSAANIPNGVVGKKYPVLSASAFDSKDGHVSVNVNAFYNYYSSSRAMAVITDGGFVPAYEGIYTVEYTAKDRSGNTSIKTVDVNVISAQTPLTAALSDKQTVFDVGQEVTVASVQVSSAYPITYVTVSASHTTMGTVSYAIDSVQKKFRPLYVGDYNVKYIIRDYLETVELSYSITVKSSDKAVFVSEAALPKYFIKNATYTLPTLNAVGFEGGKPNSIASQMTVREDNAGNATVTQGRYKVNASNSVTVIYTAAGGVEKVYNNIPVVDTGYGNRLNLDTYFYGTAFNSSAMSDHIIYETSSQGGADLEFVNYLLAANFNLSFDTGVNASGFGKINIILTDKESKDTQVKLSYRKDIAATYFSINDGTEYRISKVMGTESNESFRLRYDASSLSMIPAERLNLTVKNTLSGSEFKGFESGLLSLRIELEDITQTSQIKLYSLNGQQFSRINYDVVAPQFVQHLSGGYAEIGQQIIIPRSIVSDVLDPDVTFGMSVEGPDGEYIKDINGKVLGENTSPDVDYTFVPSQYGRYTVYYSAVDTSGELTEYSYVVHVVDTVAPVVTIKPADTSVALGDVVSIAEVELSDNISAEVGYYVYLKLPGGNIVRITENKFLANTKGKYSVIYYAYDEAGNVAVASYDITCA